MNATQELAKTLIEKLIDLQIDLAAQTSVLQNSRMSDSVGKPLDWAHTVSNHAEAFRSSRAADIYSPIAKRFFDAEPESADRLRALLALVDLRIPLQEKA